MAPRSKFVVLVDDADETVLQAGCGGFIAWLLESGVRFARAYSEPECSSSRADLLTGRVVMRHGVDRVPSKGGVLPPTETTIAQHPRIANKPSALFGKWHLDTDGVLDGPRRFGFSHFSGHIENLTRRDPPWSGHNVWPHTVDSAPEAARATYTTTAIVEDFLAWIEAQGGKSCFAMLAFSALHSPYTRPPGSDLPNAEPGEGEDPLPYWQAMAAHLGSELLRLLSSMPAAQRDGAVWVFASDNGAPQALGGGKGSLNENGIRVPFWIRAPECVQPGRSWHLPVMLTDVYRTMTGSGGDDSVDLLPVLRSAVLSPPREIALAENVAPGEPPDPDVVELAGIEERYKARRTDAGAWRLYDLQTDPTEQTDLVPGGLTGEQAAALARIEAAWSAVTG